MQLTEEQKAKLNQRNGSKTEATQRPAAPAAPQAESQATDHPPAAPQAESQATDHPPAWVTAQDHAVTAVAAQDDASKILKQAVQSKNEGLQSAAQRGQGQAVEEVLIEMSTYTTTLLAGTAAMSQAKQELRQGLSQAVNQSTKEVDFSNFFTLKATAPNAIESGKG